VKPHLEEPQIYIQDAKSHSPTPTITISKIANQKPQSLPKRNQHPKVEHGYLSTEENPYKTNSNYGISNLNDARLDFLLSRQAINCSLSTIKWYKFTPVISGGILERFALHKSGQIIAVNNQNNPNNRKCE